MNVDRAAEELRVIRQLMERPVRYSTQSGLSGILAGLAALAGLALDWRVSLAFADDRDAALLATLAVWAGVFLTALSASLVLTRLRERKLGMPFWSSVKRRILATILPPFLAGAGLTCAIVYRWYFGDGPNQWGLIPPIWMCFYGVALWQVGEFSIPELRGMGLAFVASGLVTAAFFQWSIPGLAFGTAPYWTLGITFGGYHVIYGTIVWIRYGG